MAFQTSSATDGADLLVQLVAFLAANGWTTDISGFEGAGVGRRAHLHKGAVYVNLRAIMGELNPFPAAISVPLGFGMGLYLGTGFNGANSWNSQVGGPAKSAALGLPTDLVGVGVPLIAPTILAIPNYYFFTDATNDNVVVVIQKQSGIYVYFGWGTSLSKIGTWTGGPYFFACSGGNDATFTPGGTGNINFDVTANCPFCNSDPGQQQATAYVRADVDSFTGKWLSISATTDAKGFTGKNGATGIVGNNAQTVTQPPQQFPSYARDFGTAGEFQFCQTSTMDGRANLLPVTIWASRDGSGNGYSPIGTVPNLYVANGVGRGFTPASDYLIGADTYTMFPNFAVKKVV